MINRLILLGIVLVLPAAHLNANDCKMKSDDSIHYTIDLKQYQDKDPRLLVTAEIAFADTNENFMDLEFPNRMEFYRDLYKGVRNIKIHSHEVVDGYRYPFVWRVKKNEKKNILVSYEISQNWELEHDFLRGMRPLFNKDRFQFLGSGVLLIPFEFSLRKKYKRHQTTFKFVNVPKNWRISSSMVAEGNCHRANVSIGEFERYLVLGGDFLFARRMMDGKPVTIAQDPKAPISFDLVQKHVFPIIESQRKYMEYTDFDHYLISVLRRKMPNFGGNGGISSYVLYTGPEVGKRGARSGFAKRKLAQMGSKTRKLPSRDYLLRRFFAHEHFHSFIGQRMITADHWFGEGFTEYLGDAISLKYGIVSLDEYIRILNYLSRSYFSSPYRLAHEKEIPRQNLTMYFRGALSALLFDSHIKKRTKGSASMREVVQNLLTTTTQRGNAYIYSDTDVFQAIQKVVPDFSKQEFDLIYQPGYQGKKYLTLNLGALPDFLETGTKDLFAEDIDAFGSLNKSQQVIGYVVKNSPAHKAGFRKGQKLLHYDVNFNEGFMQIKAQLDNGKVIDKKVAMSKVPAFDFKLRGNCNKECKDWFGIEPTDKSKTVTNNTLGTNLN